MIFLKTVLINNEIEYFQKYIGQDGQQYSKQARRLDYSCKAKICPIIFIKEEGQHHAIDRNRGERNHKILAKVP